MLVQPMKELIERVKSDEYDGGLPFYPQTYGLKLNDFNDSKICPLPVKGYPNSIVSKEQGKALKVSQ